MAYTTTVAVKTYLGITGSGDDTLIDGLVTYAQQIIDSYTHRMFEAGSDSTRNFDAVRDVEGRWLHLDEDLAAITTVTNGDSTVVASTKYVTEPRNETPYYALKLKLDSDLVWTYSDANEDAISIVGKWAYSEAAPDDIVHVAIRLTAWLYQQKDAPFERTATPSLGIVTVPADLPRDIKMLLEPYRKLASY